jgi:hypothetical protein
VFLIGITIDSEILQRSGVEARPVLKVMCPWHLVIREKMGSFTEAISIGSAQ